MIYVLTKPDADRVAEWLRSKGIDARAYYAGVLPSSNDDTPGLGADEYRQHLEKLLVENRVNVLVATIAHGMGFDKPDIDFVIHFQVSVTADTFSVKKTYFRNYMLYFNKAVILIFKARLLCPCRRGD